MGVGYACYCAPFFHELETRIEKKTKKIKKQLCRTEDAINKRLNTIEYCLSAHKHSSNKLVDGQTAVDDLPHTSLSHTRSLESIFDASGGKDAKSISISPVDQFEKRKNILFLRDTDNECTMKLQQRNSDCSSSSHYHQSDTTKIASSSHLCKPFYSSASLENNVRVDLWKNSRLEEGDSCESSDEECEKVADIPCNDSGYSTKMCSNSQGPSPSLSGKYVSTQLHVSD